MKVLLIDDHNLFREGLELLLQRLVNGIEVLHAVTVEKGIASLESEDRPDLVITDLSLPGVTDIDALLRVRKHAPDIPTVVVAASEDALTVKRAIDNGASGYIFKSTNSDELSKALNTILNGGVYLPVVALSSERRSSHAHKYANEMTERQREVLKWVIRGLANKQIADKLNISTDTVKSHLKAIYEILGVNNRTQAVYAVANSDFQLTP
ncbi:MAG: response regulator transcription factor [Gammaproteobacteria bacterium]